MLNKKGAMFGLDARIALAIFGALSVISGAALYSAIENAKTVQLNQYFVEIVKATEEYYLNNGKQLYDSGSSDVYLYVGDLAQNRENLSTWRGPYISTSYINNAAIRDYMTKTVHDNAFIRVYLRKSSTWTEMNDENTDEMCVVNSPDCSEWVYFAASRTDGTPIISKLFTMLDDFVDNSDGALAGKVRYNTYGADAIMYQGIQHKKTS